MTKRPLQLATFQQPNRSPNLAKLDTRPLRKQYRNVLADTGQPILFSLAVHRPIGGCFIQ